MRQLAQAVRKILWAAITGTCAYIIAPIAVNLANGKLAPASSMGRVLVHIYPEKLSNIAVEKGYGAPGALIQSEAEPLAAPPRPTPVQAENPPQAQTAATRPIANAESDGLSADIYPLALPDRFSPSTSA